MADVNFYRGSKEKYDALVTKDADTLYFLDNGELFLGEVAMGKASENLIDITDNENIKDSKTLYFATLYEATNQGTPGSYVINKEMKFASDFTDGLNRNFKRAVIKVYPWANERNLYLIMSNYVWSYIIGTKNSSTGNVYISGSGILTKGKDDFPFDEVILDDFTSLDEDYFAKNGYYYGINPILIPTGYTAKENTTLSLTTFPYVYYEDDTSYDCYSQELSFIDTDNKLRKLNRYYIKDTFTSWNEAGGGSTAAAQWTEI